uniref:60S ribosomal protein L28-2 n=1 Tax=Rhizophora mucronata TaxID=61149 RepID=A0A2P2JEC2_RHIMU
MTFLCFLPQLGPRSRASLMPCFTSLS